MYRTGTKTEYTNLLPAIHAWIIEAITQATKRISPHKYILGPPKRAGDKLETTNHWHASTELRYRQNLDSNRTNSDHNTRLNMTTARESALEQLSFCTCSRKFKQPWLENMQQMVQISVHRISSILAIILRISLWLCCFRGLLANYDVLNMNYIEKTGDFPLYRNR
jgi:hypothetical protein